VKSFGPMKIRTAIFVVYVGASAVGFALLMGTVLRDVRLRYIESMRRTMGDTAVFLAALAGEGPRVESPWAERLSVIPPTAGLLRVFANDVEDRVVFDSAEASDVGQTYRWPMRGGGPAASENYSLQNVAEVDGELRVRAPVRRAGELVGWVGVGRPLGAITEGVTEARWRLATYSGVIAVAMVCAGWWIASRLTHSLERLTAYAEAVRDGNAAMPPASRAKEIATLGRAFEEMRVTLEGKAHVERYAQALAHEFKAPLTAIRGAAELLSEDLPFDERRRFVGNLRAESDRLQLIVERLLELSALEARRAGDALEGKIDLAGVVERVCNAESRVAELKGVALACGATGGVHVCGEEFLLGQAVGNLVQNALAFTPSGGSVMVTVTTVAGRALVCVRDTGPGVPDFALDRVFERFFSLPRPVTGRKSSGLGLSIVREIARLHGGEVTLTNRSEGGAQTELTLPAV
jgi:two-component system sensor histidine kinase CreC